MARDYKRLSKHALLVLAATQTASTNGTELVDAQLKDFGSGILTLVTSAVDTTSTDEVYTVILEGRNNSTDAYTTLATTTVSATGLKVVSVDKFANRMRVRTVIAGTTPSITFSALAQTAEFHYLPGDAIVTA
jgi:hypothetical protein